MNRHIKKISNATIIGGMSAMVIATLAGCGESENRQQQPQQPEPAKSMVKEGATVTIEEKPVGTFKIIDEVPSVSTRVILKDVNGTERILSQAEIDKLVKEEEAKVDAGTSNLTKPPEQVTDSGGLGLAGTLMASMAAGMVGSYLMNKLMNNQNYQQNRRTSYRSPSTYSRSQSSFSKARANNAAAKRASSSRRSGFGSKKSPTSSRSSSGSRGFGG
jgi:hypothetical protein